MTCLFSFPQKNTNHTFFFLSFRNLFVLLFVAFVLPKTSAFFGYCYKQYFFFLTLKTKNYFCNNKKRSEKWAVISDMILSNKDQISQSTKLVITQCNWSMFYLLCSIAVRIVFWVTFLQKKRWYPPILSMTKLRRMIHRIADKNRVYGRFLKSFMKYHRQ